MFPAHAGDESATGKAIARRRVCSPAHAGMNRTANPGGSAFRGRDAAGWIRRTRMVTRELSREEAQSMPGVSEALRLADDRRVARKAKRA